MFSMSAPELPRGMFQSRYPVFNVLLWIVQTLQTYTIMLIVQVTVYFVQFLFVSYSYYMLI